MKILLFTFSLAVLSTTLPQTAMSQSDAQALKAFETADKNGNKVLSKTEFRVFIQAMADMGHSEASRAVRLGAVGYGVAWRQADKDKSGTVTLEELQAIR